MNQTGELSTGDRKWVDAIYHLAFPHCIKIVKCENAAAQKLGVDWYICLRPGVSIRLEEKVRYSDYSDLLLEEYSNYERKTVGWALDDSKITEYLSYINLPIKYLWVFYFPALRLYFQNHLEDWRKKYGCVFGKTKDKEGRVLYTTANIPVSLSEFPRNWLATNMWKYSKAIEPPPKEVTKSMSFFGPQPRLVEEDKE